MKTKISVERKDEDGKWKDIEQTYETYSPLTLRGLLQPLWLRGLFKKLKNKRVNLHLTRIISSYLDRAYHSILPTAKLFNHKVQVMKHFREALIVPWNEFYPRFMSDTAHYKNGPYSVGEFEEFLNTYVAEITDPEKKEEYCREMVGSHGMTILMSVIQTLGIPYEKYPASLEVLGNSDHLGITILAYHPYQEKWELIVYGDNSYLPKWLQKRTESKVGIALNKIYYYLLVRWRELKAKLGYRKSFLVDYCREELVSELPNSMSRNKLSDNSSKGQKGVSSCEKQEDGDDKGELIRKHLKDKGMGSSDTNSLLPVLGLTGFNISMDTAIIVVVGIFFFFQAWTMAPPANWLLRGQLIVYKTKTADIVPRKRSMSASILEEDIETIGRIGADLKHPENGRTRLGYSREEEASFDYVDQRMESLGMQVTYDPAGNLIGRWEGIDKDAKVIRIISHLDTVIAGGKFDGVIGVIAGLEIVRMLQVQNVQLTHPIEVVAYRCEESTRFEKALIGSIFAVGDEIPHKGTLGNALTLRKDLKKAMDELGYDFEMAEGFNDDLENIEFVLEIHAEQSSGLARDNIDVGLVAGIAAPVRYVFKEQVKEEKRVHKRNAVFIEFSGQQDHSGATPMHERKDALVKAAYLCTELSREIERKDFITDIFIKNGSMNTVPGTVIVALNLDSILVSSRGSWLIPLILGTNSIAVRTSFFAKLAES